MILPDKYLPPIDRTAGLATGLLQKVVLLCATGAGVGYVPVVPGTVGTLAAIPLSACLNRLADISLLAAGTILVLAILCAISFAGKAADILRQKDPGVIVIDEIVGYLLANFAVPISTRNLLMTFVLFRFFDITKIFPASRLEQLPGGVGIVADDLMAGLYSLAVMGLLRSWGVV